MTMKPTALRAGPRQAIREGLANRRGSVSLYAAMMLPAMVGMAGLGAEYAHGVNTQAQNQRIADAAAYAGALAYQPASSAAAMTSAVGNIATLNGLASSTATASIVASPTGDGNSAVQATVTRSVPLVLTTLLGTGNSLNVSATSYAEIPTATIASCILAESSSGTGITLSGGTTLTAPGCTVASDAAVGTTADVAVPCGTYITTTTLYYASTTAPSVGCLGVTAPSGKTLAITQKATPDPLRGNTTVASAVAHMATVAAMVSPVAPTVSTGGDISFAYSVSATNAQLTADHCTGSFTSPLWTMTCSGQSTYTFGNITVGGGIAVNFNTTGSASNTYKFSGMIDNTGTTMNFGPGTYSIAKGVITGGGTTTNFGAGSYSIGPTSSSCAGSVSYSICNTSTLTFGGPGSFVLSNGIFNGGGASLTLGTGSANSYQIGAASDGNAFNLGGGATTKLADATSSGLFTVVGMVNASSGGGSCLILPAASAHDINGSFVSAGGTIAGAGIYTVNGYFGLGTGGGGDVSCSGTNVGLSGSNVTFVVSGIVTPSYGSCANQAFCIASGFGHVAVTAPGSGTYNSFAIIGPQSTSNHTGAAFTDGATSTSLSGMVYFPNGPVTLGGGASVGNGTGQCLELIGSQVTMTGGTALGSTCTGLTGGSGGSAASGTVKLVQ